MGRLVSANNKYPSISGMGIFGGNMPFSSLRLECFLLTASSVISFSISGIKMLCHTSNLAAKLTKVRQ